MAKSKNWVITASEARPLAEIARDLAKAGLKKVQVLDTISLVTGSAGDEVVAKLRKVKGVRAVEEETPTDIGPPDSDEPC